MNYQLQINDKEVETLKQIKKEYAMQSKWLITEILDNILDKVKKIKIKEKIKKPIIQEYRKEKTWTIKKFLTK